jgi:hypothetical protein
MVANRDDVVRVSSHRRQSERVFGRQAGDIGRAQVIGDVSSRPDTVIASTLNGPWLSSGSTVDAELVAEKLGRD